MKNLFVYYLTCVATIGGLLIGYDTGIVSGALLLIGDYWQLTDLWKEGIVSATIGTATVFPLIAGYLTDRLGRKKVIMVSSVIFTVGAGVMGAAPDKIVLFVGRLIVGAGIGITAVTVPVYIAEAAPPEIRGRLVLIFQLFITFGIVVSSVVAGLFSTDKENGWRYMLGLPGVPSVIQFVGFFWLPDSPRWLVEKGRIEEARGALQQIRKSDDVEKELAEIQDAVRSHETTVTEGNQWIVLRVLKDQRVRRALIIGCGLNCFSQTTGINAVVYYSGSILKLAGFPVDLAIWLVVIPNSVNFLCTFIAFWLVETKGRRIMILGSLLGVMAAQAVLAVGFQLSSAHSPPVYQQLEMQPNTNTTLVDRLCDECVNVKECGFCYTKSDPKTTGSCVPSFKDKPEQFAQYIFNANETLVYNASEATLRCDSVNVYDKPNPGVYHYADSYCPTDYSWVIVLGVALFVLGFSVGLGPMPWAVNSEIYPTWARSTSMSLAMIVGCAVNLILSLTFLTLLDNLTKHGTFWLFFGISSLGFVFIFFLLPETKNKSLEEIEELFKARNSRGKTERETTGGETKGNNPL